MKKTAVLLSILFTLACQKQSIEPQSVTSASSDAVTVIADSVKFDPIPPGVKHDGQTGRITCLLESFEIVPHETAIARAFAFTVTKSAGATLTSAKFFIDGETPRIVQITGSKLVFTYKARAVTPGQEDFTGKHTIAMRITGEGAAGEWYQVRLDSALFIKLDPKRNMFIKGLPQTSFKMIY